MGYYPTWETPHYQLWDNGGRHPWEVFDLNCNIWRFGFSLTLWRIGNFSRFIKVFAPNKACTGQIAGGSQSDSDSNSPAIRQ